MLVKAGDKHALCHKDDGLTPEPPFSPSSLPFSLSLSFSGTTVAAVRPSQAVGGSAASSASTAAASATDGEKPSKRAKPSPSADTDTDTATAEMEAVAEVVAAEPADHADSTEH